MTPMKTFDKIYPQSLSGELIILVEANVPMFNGV
jgi:hypothetical protein